MSTKQNAILWLASSVTLILGLLLMNMSIGAAVATLGAIGMVLSVAAFLLYLRLGDEDRP